MRIYILIMFGIALLSNILGYIVSYYREKMNRKFIESKSTFSSVIGHHFLAFVNIIILIVGFVIAIIFAMFLLVPLFSIISNEKCEVNPLLNVPFSIALITILTVVCAFFMIMTYKNRKTNKTIYSISGYNQAYKDESMGISGNLRYQIVFVLLPITIFLFLANMILGINFV